MIIENSELLAVEIRRAVGANKASDAAMSIIKAMVNHDRAGFYAYHAISELTYLMPYEARYYLNKLSRGPLVVKEKSKAGLTTYRIAAWAVVYCGLRPGVDSHVE